MIITITSIKLRSVWLYFKLTYLAMHIVKQAKGEKGFVKLKNTGFGYLHYTLSVWESEEDLRRFARSGAHLTAMKQSKSLATEVRIYTFQTESLPGWKEAKQLLLDKGKVILYK